MPVLWKSQNDFHRTLESSHRTRASHIPTSRSLSCQVRERRINRPQIGSLSERRTGLLSERRLHGWMSALETRAKPYLLAMLRNFAIPLDREAQTELSAWVMKTVMVLEFLSPERAVTPKSRGAHSERVCTPVRNRRVAWTLRRRGLELHGDTKSSVRLRLAICRGCGRNVRDRSFASGLERPNATRPNSSRERHLQVDQRSGSLGPPNVPELACPTRGAGLASRAVGGGGRQRSPTASSKIRS